MDCYQVGGAVRDRLLGITSKDRDWVVVGSTPEALEALGFRRVGSDFPVFLHPESNEEYALARTERKTGRGYKGFRFDTSTDVTLEQDLDRRDLTINAMAEDADGNIIDPFGGRDDLRNRVLRHIGAAFVEDPLRVLRVARFAARFDFSIAPETVILMTEMTASGELSDLVPERVWRELERALGEPFAERFITVLRECGALAALFPEIDRLFGVPQPEKHHPEIDTGEHICLALRQATRLAANTRVRFAVLVHDLGKGVTPQADLPRHPMHGARGVPLVEAFCVRFRVPNDYRDLALLVTKHHLRVHSAVEMRPAKVLDLLEELDAIRRPDRFIEALLACRIDATGRAGLAGADYPSSDYLRRAADAVRSVETKKFSNSGLSGEEIRAALRVARIEALTDFKKAQ